MKHEEVVRCDRGGHQQTVAGPEALPGYLSTAARRPRSRG